MNTYMKKILFLSPHSDDIALSIGGIVANNMSDYFDCYMHTIFTMSKHAPYLDQIKSIESITAQRIQEDRIFCQQFGITYRNARFKETTVRGYPTIASIFQAKTPFKDPLYKPVEKYIQELLTSSAWDFVFAPAGIGNHVEHLIVREICKSHTLESTIFYEDLPYAQDYSDDTIKKLILTVDNTLEPISFSFSASDKLAAIRLYESQISTEEETKTLKYGHRHRPEIPSCNRQDKTQPIPIETVWAQKQTITKFKSIICYDLN